MVLKDLDTIIQSCETAGGKVEGSDALSLMKVCLPMKLLLGDPGPTGITREGAVGHTSS